MTERVGMTAEDAITAHGEGPMAKGRRAVGAAKPVGVLVLSVLAVVFTLYLGKEIILPIVMALVLALMLAPVMRFLTRKARLPKALAALLVILTVFGAIGAVGFTVSRPLTGWVKKVPESLPVLKEKLAALRGPIDYVQNGLRELQEATRDAAQADADAEGKPHASQDSHGEGMTIGSFTGIAGSLATGTATILSRTFTTMIILFFMLVSGNDLLKGFVKSLPEAEDRANAIAIARKVETSIAGYLVTITAMNAAVGVATGLAMWACGLGTPLLWGAMAFVLNYVPILGPLAGVAIFFAAGILTLAWPLPALLPAAIYLVIHLVEGETITPMLLAQRFTLNPVLVIVSLFVWHGIWGIPGALLAVPILAMMKIVCDNTGPLKPIGGIIGS